MRASRRRRVGVTPARAELGRISYLLTDKTGCGDAPRGARVADAGGSTLTQNDMVFKRLHVGRASFGKDALPEIAEHILAHYAEQARPPPPPPPASREPCATSAARRSASHWPCQD